MVQAPPPLLRTSSAGVTPASRDRFAGGVEKAFMSTSRDSVAALRYSGGDEQQGNGEGHSNVHAMPGTCPHAEHHASAKVEAFLLARGYTCKKDEQPVSLRAGHGQKRWPQHKGWRETSSGATQAYNQRRVLYRRTL